MVFPESSDLVAGSAPPVVVSCLDWQDGEDAVQTLLYSLVKQTFLTFSASHIDASARESSGICGVTLSGTNFHPVGR